VLDSSRARLVITPELLDGDEIGNGQTDDDAIEGAHILALEAGRRSRIVRQAGNADLESGKGVVEASGEVVSFGVGNGAAR